MIISILWRILLYRKYDVSIYFASDDAIDADRMPCNDYYYLLYNRCSGSPERNFARIFRCYYRQTIQYYDITGNFADLSPALLALLLLLYFAFDTAMYRVI